MGYNQIGEERMEATGFVLATAWYLRTQCLIKVRDCLIGA